MATITLTITDLADGSATVKCKREPELGENDPVMLSDRIAVEAVEFIMDISKHEQLVEN